MNSQVFPLPTTRVDLDLDISGPAEADRPIGVILSDWGRVSQENVQRILDYQRKAGLPFGEAGIAMGLITEEDVRQALSLQFGQACPMPDAGLGPELLAAWQPESEAVEHLRALRSQLMLRWFENDARHAALAVLSAGPGEGRSYITANLAVLFSQLGKRTLVIDADLRRPRQHEIFGLSSRVGLSTILSGRAGREAVIEIESVPGLAVLPAGALPPNPQELLARPGLPRRPSESRSKWSGPSKKRGVATSSGCSVPPTTRCCGPPTGQASGWTARRLPPIRNGSCCGGCASRRSARVGTGTAT
jgi:protein-tyrosine kinase